MDTIEIETLIESLDSGIAYTVSPDTGSIGLFKYQKVDQTKDNARACAKWQL